MGPKFHCARAAAGIFSPFPHARVVELVDTQVSESQITYFQ